MLKHRAAAGSRLLGIGVLGKIPAWVIDLQQMVEDIAYEGRMRAGAFQLEHDVAR